MQSPLAAMMMVAESTPCSGIYSATCRASWSEWLASAEVMVLWTLERWTLERWSRQN